MKLICEKSEVGMKKIWKIYPALLIFTLCAAGAGQVQGTAAVQTDLSQTGSVQTAAKPYVQLKYQSRGEYRLSANQIRQGDSGKVSLKGNKGSSIKWSSSRPGILTVDSRGNVKAKHTGTAVVTAKYTYRKKVYRYSLTIQVVNRWKAEQRKFPTGSYWNNGENNNKVTGTPCIHDEYPYCANCTTGCRSNCFVGKVAGVQITGYQCHGFALKVASDIYGDMNRWSYCSDYRDVQAGDVVRINASHTIIVTKVFNNRIQYADCNANDDCQIRWGQTMSKKELKSAFTYMYTRKK